MDKESLLDSPTNKKPVYPNTSHPKSLSPTKKKEEQKEIIYKNPKVKIGKGKLGPVDLIIYKEGLYALKRVPKKEIDPKPKRIQHLKQEKNILNFLKQMQRDVKKGIYKPNRNSFDQVLNSEEIEAHMETKDTSQRNSYLIDETEKPPLPLNYIVELEDTFLDNENINFIFEYLPGQDLYWVI